MQNYYRYEVDFTEAELVSTGTYDSNDTRLRDLEFSDKK